MRATQTPRGQSELKNIISNYVSKGFYFILFFFSEIYIQIRKHKKKKR